MSGLLKLKRFKFAEAEIKRAYNFLRKAGEDGFEAVALFVGYIENDEAKIEYVLFPEQKSYKLETGLMYAVSGEELHKINVWLYQNNLKLLAQIHSHPTEAYHSEADDTFPIMSTIGGLSIVVPYFAKSPLNHFEWAYYRLSTNGEWLELNEENIRELILIKK